MNLILFNNIIITGYEKLISRVCTNFFGKIINLLHRIHIIMRIAYIKKEKINKDNFNFIMYEKVMYFRKLLN